MSMKRSQLIGGASIIALLSGLAVAQAADIEIDATLSTIAEGFLALDSVIVNDGNVTSTASGNTGEFTDLATGLGGNPSVINVDGNLIGAFATGSNFDTSISVDLINDALAPGAGLTEIGIAMLSVALNEGVIATSAEDNTLSISELDFTSGSLQNADNLITAQTTLNRGLSVSSGEVPNGYTDDTAGSIDFDSASDPIFGSSATIAVGSVQQSTTGATGSNALVADNEISMTVTPDVGDQEVDGSFEVTGNEVSATFVGNTARSSVEIEAGTAPGFEGSIAVSNIQANEDVGLDTAGASALNSGTSITAVIGNEAAGPDSTLVSALSVSDNLVSATATGNQALANGGGEVAGNQIVFDDTMNFAGAPLSGNTATFATDSGAAIGSVDADLALFNFQANDGGDSVSAEVSGADVGALVQNIDGGNLQVSDNTVQAQARGNAGSNAILAPGIDGSNASFDGSVALLSGQTNLGIDTSATVTGTSIVAQVGNATGTGDTSSLTTSTISMDGNRVAANSIANQIGNSVALGGASVAVGGDDFLLNSGIRNDGQVSSTAGATLSNVQSNYNGDVLATNTDTLIQLDASDLTALVDDSTLSIAGTAGSSEIDAVAAISSASNVLALDGTNISGSAGLNNLQVEEDGIVTASVTDPSVEILVNTISVPGAGIEDTSVSIQNVGVRALAYSATAGNTVRVTAGAGAEVTTATPGNASTVTFNLAEADGLFFDNDDTALPTVVANYALLSNQNSEADVTAEIVAGSAPFSILIGNTALDPQEGDVTTSTVLNDNNSLTANAFGNQVTNDMALSLGNLTAGGTDNVANVTNVQTLGDATEILASIDTSGAGFSTEIAHTVDNSTISVSNNTTQAQAFGNRASSGGTGAIGNRLVVDATTLDLAGPARDGLTMDTGAVGEFTADAAFSVQNVQSGADVVSAALGNNTNAGTSLIVGGDVLSSALMQDNNQFISSAFNNQAVNDLILSATTVATTTGVQNFQVTSSTTFASTGEPGAVGSTTEVPVDVPFSILVGPDGTIPADYDDGTNSWTVSGGTFSADITGLSPEAQQELEDAGWTIDGTTATISALELFPDPIPDGDFSTAIGTPQNLSFTSTELQIVDGEPSTKDIMTSIGGNSGDITASSVSISNNLDLATSVANDAISRLDVEAVTLDAADGTEAFGLAALDLTGTETLTANADHALSNYQLLQNGGVTEAEAAVTLGIAIDSGFLGGLDAVISGSGLEIVGNQQQALAMGNRAENALSLTATNIGDDAGGLGATSALASYQEVGALEDLLSTSWMDVSAPAGMIDSSLEITGNISSAVATFNQAINTSRVSGTNLATAFDIGGAAAPGQASATFTGSTGVVQASADHSLANIQSVGSESTIASTSTLNIDNQELGGSSVVGIANSSTAINGNTAQAQATSNASDNLLDLSAGAGMSATGALTNAQTNAAGVVATANGTIGLALEGDGINTVSGSSISLSDNAVTARARGNQAQNVLNVDVGAAYANLAPGASAGNSVAGSGATASYAVLNLQGNSGDVAATVTGNVQASLNGGVSATIGNSTVAISGNRYEATSFGNVATNLMSATVRPGGTAPMALANVQTNSGNISSTANSMTIGVNIAAGGQAVSGSSARIGSNRVSASATGNSVVSRISSNN